MAREASVERNTKETEIKLKLNLDGTGYSDIETGVGFFDHMLDGFTRHGLFDLAIRVHGDLQVDDHHTIEDTGIVLGSAIKETIGDKKGIRRYGCRDQMKEGSNEQHHSNRQQGNRNPRPPLMVERRLPLRSNLAQDRVQGAPSVVRS